MQSINIDALGPPDKSGGPIDASPRTCQRGTRQPTLSSYSLSPSGSNKLSSLFFSFCYHFLHMKLLTTNCRGASHHTTLRKVLQEAKKSNSVISVLTETKLKQIDNHYLRKNWGEYLNTPHVFSDTDDEGHRKAGLAICFRLGSLEEINKVIPSGVGRHIVMSAKIEGFQYTIIGVYGNDQSDRESLLSFQHLQRDIDTVTTEFPCENTIMLGDFNCILHTADSLRGIINKPRTARKLTEIIEDLNMVDVWEHSSHPDDEHFTYGQLSSYQKSIPAR